MTSRCTTTKETSVPYHIEDVLESVRNAPQPPAHTTTDDIINRARRTRTRRNLAIGTGVVACLAAAVTVLPQIAPASSGGIMAANDGATPMASFSPPPAAPIDKPQPVKKIDFKTNLGQYRVGAYQIGPATTVTEGYTELPVYHDGSTWQNEIGTKFPLVVATLTVYQKGVYDPSTFGGVGDETFTISEQYSVTVGGRNAIGRDWTFGTHRPVSEQSVMAGLAWQYADEAWATFVPNNSGQSNLSRATMAEIAAKLNTTTERDLKVPYHLGYVPKGWQAVSVEQTEAKYGMSDSVVYLHQGPLADPSTRVDAVLPGHLAIGVFPKAKPGEKNEYSSKPGIQCYPDGESCSVIRGDYIVSLSGYGKVLSLDDIRKIADGLELRDVPDRSTWEKVDF
jgi:hypothetical protein